MKSFWAEGWTEQRIQRLREMQTLGYTNGQIAMDLGTTRNAIAGKLSRINGYKRTKHPRKSRLYVAHRTKPFRAPIELPPARKTHIDYLKIGFMERHDNQCADRLDEKGDDGLYLYCGHPTYRHHPYCFDHCCINYSEFV